MILCSHFPTFDISVGARLLHYASNKESVTDDHWVLSVVSEGLSIEFVSEPIQFALPMAEFYIPGM